MVRKILCMGFILFMATMLVLPSAQAGKKNDTLTIAVPLKFETLDMYSTIMIEVLYNHRAWSDTLLWRKTASNELMPCLSTSWRWVDELTLEFKLRKGVKFHNGEEFDADDVVYTFNWIKDPANKVFLPTRINWIKAAVKLDKYTVQIKTKYVYPLAPHQICTDLYILPKDYHSKVGAKEFQTRPIGTGPYKVKSFTPGDKLVLVKNDAYFGGPKGKPQIGTIVIKPIPELQARVAGLLAGQLDWINAVRPDQAKKLAQMPDLKVKYAPMLTTTILVVDTAGRSGKNPFQDKKVRQALAHAINRQAIIDNLLPGTQLLNMGGCHPKQFGCFPNVVDYAYNPAKAKKLLAEAGYPDGFEFSITSSDKDDGAMLEAVVSDLKQVGIKANIDWMTTGARLGKTFKGQLQCYQTNWTSGGMLDVGITNAVFFWKGGFDYIRDNHLIALSKKAGGTIDPEFREKTYKEIYQYVAENALWIPLFIRTDIQVYNPELDINTEDFEWPRFYQGKWK